MGAVTVAIKRRYYPQGGKMVIADVTFSGTYAAGGDTYTNTQFELSTIDAIVDMGAAVGSATTGYVLSPDLATAFSQARRSSGTPASGRGQDGGQSCTHGCHAPHCRSSGHQRPPR